MTNKPATKKADTPPDDVYETTIMHPSNLDGWVPNWTPEDDAAVVSADKKES